MAVVNGPGRVLKSGAHTFSDACLSNRRPLHRKINRMAQVGRHCLPAQLRLQRALYVSKIASFIAGNEGRRSAPLASAARSADAVNKSSGA